MSKRYVATGKTHLHRDVLTSWAWHWDPERRAWIEDNDSEESERCIIAIRDLPGVIVTIEDSPQ